MTTDGMTVHLTAAEVEGLKRVFPDLSPSDAALTALRAELRRRYQRARKSGRVVDLQALKRAIESV